MNRSKIEALISFIYKQCFKHFYITVFIILATTFLLARNLSKIQVDPSFDRALSTNSQDMAFYKETIKEFGSDKNAIIFIKDSNIFSQEKLEILQNLVWDFQEVKHIEKVQSVFSTSFIRNEKLSLTTAPMFENLENIEERLPDLLDKVAKDPFINGRLINASQNMLSIIIQVDNQKISLKDIHNQIEKRIENIKGDFELMYQTGEPTVEQFSYKQMIDSQKVYIPLIGFILLICFYFFIKSIHAFFVTVVVTSLSTLWTFSLMPLLDIPIQLMTSIVPGIVLTLSATEIIHIFASYNHSDISQSKLKRLQFVASDIGLATTLTFTTTALGFLTIYLNDVQILKEFAVISSLNLILAFLITCLYFPIHIKLFDLKKIVKEEAILEKYFIKINRLIYSNYLHFLRSKNAIIFILLFIVTNVYYSTKVIVDNDAYEMIRNRTTVKKKITHYKDHFGGTRTFFAIIKSKNSFKEEDNLVRLWRAHLSLEKRPDVSHVESFAGLMTLLNREMNGGSETFHKIPSSKDLVEQYILTLSRDDLTSYISSDYLKTNIKISHDVSSTLDTEALLASINEILLKDFPVDKYDITITSKNFLNLTASRSFIEKQTSSLITISILITLILGAYFKSFKIGILSLIPNVFPIIGLFGIMGLLDIPLNIGTCIVAAVTIGIAADDTIHLFTRFFKEYKQNSHILWVCKRTIKYEVVPIFTTSLSLSLSFLVFSTSDFVPLIQFGLLSSYVLILAIFSDLYIAPLLLTYFAKRDI